MSRFSGLRRLLSLALALCIMTACGLTALAAETEAAPEVQTTPEAAAPEAAAQETGAPAEPEPSPADGDELQSEPAPSPEEEPEEGESGHEPLPYETVPVYVDGLLFTKAYEKDGELFLSAAAICEYLGLELDWWEQEGSLSLTLPGAELRWDAGADYLTANGRYLYAPQGRITQGNELYLPPELLGRLLGLRVLERSENCFFIFHYFV